MYPSISMSAPIEGRSRMKMEAIRMHPSLIITMRYAHAVGDGASATIAACQLESDV
jgi:ABC-type phosphate/phosphonate transport system permease subunit